MPVVSIQYGTLFKYQDGDTSEMDHLSMTL